MIQLTDNLEINKPAPVDDRLGVFESTAEALAYIAEDRRYVGLTLIVDNGNGAVEYWFENGVQDGDLTAKSTGGTQINADWNATSGVAEILNKPTIPTSADFIEDAINNGVVNKAPSENAVFDALATKFNNPTGTTAQYLDGLGTPTDFPTAGQAGTLVRQVRNETGATLSKGTVVYISGASGNKALVSKAIATGDGTSAQTFGVVQADITNNQNGYVVVRGDLAGLNTSAYTEGAQLYLSSTTAGEYTSTKQYAPNHLVYIAIVTRSHVNQGSIEVAIQNGFELDELHNVQAQNPSNKNSIFFDSSDSQWKARAVSATDINANVSDTEFSYLDGVTSSIQTQINTKVTANNAITGATKTKITYDSKGLVTAGADLTASDIPTLNSYPQVYFYNTAASASVTTLAKIFEGTAINITDMRVGTTFICTGFYTGSASSNKGFGLSSNNTTPTLVTASFTSGQFYFMARYIGGANGVLRITRVGGAGFGVSATTSYVDINASSGTHTLSFWGSSSTGTIIVEHCLIQMIY